VVGGGERERESSGQLKQHVSKASGQGRCCISKPDRPVPQHKDSSSAQSGSIVHRVHTHVDPWKVFQDF